MELKKRLIEALIDSVSETFTSILSLVPVVTESSDGAGPPPTEGVEIIASIGLAGGLEGSLNLILSKEAACKAVSKMLDCQFPDICQDVLDGSGELANILAGGLKNRIHGDGYSYEISIPSVIQGSNPMTLSKPVLANVVTLYVDCQELNFKVVLFFLVKKIPAAGI